LSSVSHSLAHVFVTQTVDQGSLSIHLDGPPRTFVNDPYCLVTPPAHAQQAAGSSTAYASPASLTAVPTDVAVVDSSILIFSSIYPVLASQKHRSQVGFCM
jgi:hypothetical protein